MEINQLIKSNMMLLEKVNVLEAKIVRLENEVETLKGQQALYVQRGRDLADGEAFLGRLLQTPVDKHNRSDDLETGNTLAGPAAFVSHRLLSRTPSPPLLHNRSDHSETESTLAGPTAVTSLRVLSRTPSPPLLIISSNVGDGQDVDDNHRQPSSPLPPPLTRQNKRKSRLASSQSHRFSSSKTSFRRRSSRNIRSSITKGRKPSSVSSDFEYQSPVSNSQSFAKHCPSRKKKVQLPKKAKTAIRRTTSTKIPRAVAKTPRVSRSCSSLNDGAQVLRDPAPGEHQNPSIHLCDICGQQFSRIDNMYKHIRNVHKINRDGHSINITAEWKCTECTPNVAFSAKNYLQEHVFKFHVNPGATYRCGFCQKPFRTGSGCRQHEKRCRKKPGNST